MFKHINFGTVSVAAWWLGKGFLRDGEEHLQNSQCAKLLFCAETERVSCHLSADIATGKVGAACTGTAGTQGNCGTNAVCSATSVCQCEDGYTGPVAGDCGEYTKNAFLPSFTYRLSFAFALSQLIAIIFCRLLFP